MIHDCRIEFRPNGDDIDLKVSSHTLPPAGRLVTRSHPDLTQDELDQFASGNPPAVLIQNLIARLGAWLHDPDLDLPQILQLPNPGDDLWRMIFSVEDVRDEKLRSDLAALPLELMTLEGTQIPYALHNRVSSIVHLLPKVGNPVRPSSSWPLRILLVRSSPRDIPDVPEARPIREAILGLRPDLVNADLVRVDLLSSEDGAAVIGSPTKAQLATQLKHGYDILVYLGHGDVLEVQEGLPPIGALQFEGVDGYHDTFDAHRLSNLLHNYSVPVVLLVGCLTAADLPPEIDTEIPRWIQGSQGVAQALINGMSGVQFAVGMRCRIEADDATEFLEEFFRSLLNNQPENELTGNLEAAVRNARLQLRVTSRQDISWAAPVIFRTLGQEPTFTFLASPPIHHVRISEKSQRLREEFWSALAGINWSLRTPTSETSVENRFREILETVESEVDQDVSARRAVLVQPCRQEVDPNSLQELPGRSEIGLAIETRGSLEVRRLEGVVIESSGNGELLALESSEALEEAGFKLLTDRQPPHRIRFVIEHGSEEEHPLPVGEILKLRMALGPEEGVFYPITIEDLKAKPERSLCPGSNAVIVPSP